MEPITLFSPPAYLDDFDDIPDQAKAWHRAVDGWFEASIRSEGKLFHSDRQGGPLQFYNPARSPADPADIVIAQAVAWNAFPKELLRQFGRERALIEADKMRTLDQFSKAYDKPVYNGILYRPQNEYCEWHTVRHPDTQKIIRVSFSSEPPEYWRAMFGDTLRINGKNVRFPGNRYKVLALYRQLVSPAVEMDDLICRQSIPPFAVKGGYNMYNKWNTALGIVHLCSPPNALQAEIQLGADSSIPRANAAGDPVVLPEPLICCAQFGNPNRNSDPTIGATVNALTRTGAMVTLADPVGIYMDQIDTTGWTYPDGTPADDCCHIRRGRLGMIERLEIAVPVERGFDVGDITIGGKNIEYGGQIAECITVKLVAVANMTKRVNGKPVHCTGRCCTDPSDALQLIDVDDRKPRPSGTVDTFSILAEVSVASMPVLRRTSSLVGHVR